MVKTKPKGSITIKRQVNLNLVLPPSVALENHLVQLLPSLTHTHLNIMIIYPPNISQTYSPTQAFPEDP